MDRSGNLFVAATNGLDIYDPNLKLLGQVIVGDVALTVAVRPGQAFACNPVRTPAARLFVFDTRDLELPTLSAIVNIPFTDRECRGIEFDDDGYLWVTSKARLIKLGLDLAGNPVTSEFFPTFGNPGDVAFQPETGRIFYTAVNKNFIEVLEPFSQLSTIATITNICDNAILSPGQLAFSHSGSLFVGCHNLSGAMTDIVAFPATDLASIIGPVDVSMLSAVRFVSLELNGSGTLAVKQITVDGLDRRSLRPQPP